MRRVIVAAALLALAACQDKPSGPVAPQDGPSAPLAAPAAAPRVSASLAVRNDAGADGPFRLDDVPRLGIQASCRSLEAGRHSVRVDVVDPGGALYAQLRGPLEAAADGTGVSSHVLEVHGTPIEGFRQVGRWRFDLSVDGVALVSAEVDLTE